MVACLTTYHYNPCLNLGVGIYEGVFSLTLLHYLWRVIGPYSLPFAQVAVIHQSSPSCMTTFRFQYTHVTYKDISILTCLKISQIYKPVEYLLIYSYFNHNMLIVLQ